MPALKQDPHRGLSSRSMKPPWMLELHAQQRKCPACQYLPMIKKKTMKKKKTTTTTMMKTTIMGECLMNAKRLVWVGNLFMAWMYWPWMISPQPPQRLP